MNVAQRIAELWLWNQRCAASNNAVWEEITATMLKTLLDTAPSGSGFDNGTKLSYADNTRLVFNTAFHHMDDHGGYDGWTEHTITVHPVFSGLEIRTSGRDRNDIKDFIHETFHYWLNQAIPAEHATRTAVVPSTEQTT